jgi:hypothetical protein
LQPSLLFAALQDRKLMPSQAKERPTGDDDKVDSGLDLKALKLEQVLVIDRALVEIGDFGEVHLIIKDGQLKAIRKMRSEGFPWPED